ncbi:unannotated protein [freshwater metagenome]|uniref:Unannotated protein n=1 Tax=freshwater metagenome TaxID=449393 RepID=A0A6J7A5L8_9ZZZZ
MEPVDVIVLAVDLRVEALKLSVLHHEQHATADRYLCSWIRRCMHATSSPLVDSICLGENAFAVDNSLVFLGAGICRYREQEPRRGSLQAQECSLATGHILLQIVKVLLNCRPLIGLFEWVRCSAHNRPFSYRTACFDEQVVVQVGLVQEGAFPALLAQNLEQVGGIGWLADPVHRGSAALDDLLCIRAPVSDDEWVRDCGKVLNVRVLCNYGVELNLDCLERWKILAVHHNDLL